MTTIGAFKINDRVVAANELLSRLPDDLVIK